MLTLARRLAALVLALAPLLLPAPARAQGMVERPAPIDTPARTQPRPDPAASAAQLQKILDALDDLQSRLDDLESRTPANPTAPASAPATTSASPDTAVLAAQIAELRDLVRRSIETRAPGPSRGPAGAIDPPGHASAALEAGAARPADDPEMADAERRRHLVYLQRETQKYEEARRELWYYNWQGRVMFVAVHLLLLTAIWMAWREFAAAQRARRRAEAEAATQEISLSLQGVALKTTLQGVVLMGFALGFYFLYLKFVYPMVTLGDPV